MNGQLEVDNRLIISYLKLRQLVGILGTLLPFALAIGAVLFFSTGIRSSVSDYYHTGMGDVFVGTLCTIGFFLYAYKGYSSKDDRIGNLACICALGVAFFPTTPDTAGPTDPRIIGYIHLFFAASLFLLLAYFCLALFTKTDPDGTPTRKKLQRNKVYKTCGQTILLCIILIVVFGLLPESLRSSLQALKPVFWLEAIAVVVFGISWLTKGEAILKDEA